MKQIKFDFNNLFSFSIGSRHGVTLTQLTGMRASVNSSHRHLERLFLDARNRVNLGLEWINLPFQNNQTLKETQELGDELGRRFDNLLFLGIGGSYLGLKAAQDALLSPYYNELKAARGGRPKIYFEGNNLDPGTLEVLLKNLEAKKTFVVVISKSGETIETKAAFLVVREWLKNKVGKFYGRQILAITDQESGALRKIVNEENSSDALSFRSLPLLRGVGGRFSEFNMGLLHLAATGINLREVLAGAAKMLKRCSSPDIFKNPAYMYALLMNILYRKKAKPISIIMPFSEGLKSTADWYVQLLAESLGKKYSRKIKVNTAGIETWEMDKKSVVNVGRTPISSRGTSDLHSIQQNNIEGENNKIITFIRVEKFKADIRIPGKGDFLSSRFYSWMLTLAQEATEWALVRESRPNCSIIMPEITPFYWGELILFFEIATAFEGELLNINAFDQPGVEGYKNYMYYKLLKPDIPEEVINDIEKNPLTKNHKFII